MIALMKGSLAITILVMLSIVTVPQVEEPVMEQGSKWNIKIVDYVGEYRGHTSLALDSLDYPHISYTDYPRHDLKYSKWTGYGWNIEIIDSMIFSSSLALDGNDYARVGYFAGMNATVKYAKWDGSTWTNETVDAASEFSGGTSLALDGNDYPRMSYAVDIEHNYTVIVRYASWNGTTWKFENVDYLPGDLIWTSLDLDSNYHPQVGYSAQGGDDLNFAKWNGSSWTIQVVDYIGRVGGYLSLATDRKDYPHIGYHDFTHQDLRYAMWNGSEWAIETVESVGDVGRLPSLALDGNDYPHISHYDAANQDLRYVHWNGTAWNAEVVDSIGVVGLWSSLAIDSDGNPHISYLDRTNGNLKYATKAELKPPPREISLDIDPDTLNLKSRGGWVTAYLSSENASVYDVDVSSILLQDTLVPERYDYQDDILMLKFNRQALIGILEVGNSVEIKLSGKWKDGTDFKAYDYIRVISPVRWIDSPWIPVPNPSTHS